MTKENSCIFFFRLVFSMSWFARHLKKTRSRYLGRGFALKSFLEVSYILQHLETRVRIYTISIDPDICEL